MANTFKNIREAISSSQLKRLKKEYEHMRNIDMSKHKGQVKKVTAVISKLKIGTLIDLYKENIPWISDIAKSLVLKDKRFAHHVEEVDLNEYKVENDPMAGEFGFVSKKAMDDNVKKVGGNKGVQAMIKKGKTVDQISKEFGMYPDAVKKMAKGQTL